METAPSFFFVQYKRELNKDLFCATHQFSFAKVLEPVTLVAYREIF